MKLAANVGMRNKLALMLCLPLLALLYFCVDAAWERWHQARELESLLTLSELAVKTSALVHESQKERGMTALFLGSKGTKYQAELSAQRAETDRRAAALRQHLERLDRGYLGSDLLQSLDDALGRLAKIAATREAAGAMSVTAPVAMGYYTEMNSAFLKMISQTSHLSDRGELARRLAAYASFLHAKEQAGLERATLSNTFAQDAFGPGMYERFLAVVTAQETYGAMFDSLASAADRDFARKALIGPAVDGAGRMRKLALDQAAAGKFGVEPGDWFKTMTGKIELMKQVEDRLSEGLVARATDLRARAWTALVLFLVLGAGAVAGAVVVAVAVARSITTSLGAVLATMRELAAGEGDLTRRIAVAGRDEVGELALAFNRFMDKLRDILSQVKDVASHAGTAAQQLSAAAAQLSDGAQEQASSLEETAASLEEITGTVKQNADNARQANQVAVGSRDVAEKGGQVVADAVRSMSEINQSSHKIADIITTIDEIAFQTNLLALNAAVEAARAGEQGRGFAVVAAEVRNLAQRSAGAAKEIKDLIQDSVRKVEAGSQLVNRSGETLSEIVTSVKHVTDIVAEIAAASQEQTTGIDQVNQAVTQMDQVTQSNAAQTEELSSTAQSLADQAEQLQILVGRFKLDEGAATDGRTVVRGAAELARGAKVPAARKAPLPGVRASRPPQAGPTLIPARGHAGSNGSAHAGNGSDQTRDDGFEEF